MITSSGDQQAVTTIGSRGIAALTAEELLRSFSARLDQPEDVDDAGPSDRLAAVIELQAPYEPHGRLHPPGGVPEQMSNWKDVSAAVLPGLIRRAEDAVNDAGAGTGEKITVVGAEGSPQERLGLVQECIEARRPVISVSVTGSITELLATGDSRAASLSILAWMPHQPLAAATVTTENVLTADCSQAYRRDRGAAGWEELSADTPFQAPDPRRIIIPRSLQDRCKGLSERYSKVSYEEVTTPAIIDAVLNRSVPAAIHASDHVLNGAILLIAAARGLAVRLHNSKGDPLKPWDASRILYRAISTGSTDLPPLVIARDELTARRLTQHLELNDEEGTRPPGGPR